MGKVSNDYALRHMDRWRFYSFTVPSIRRENSARKQLNLERDGSNLAQVLLTLKTERPKAFSAIEEVLKLAIPEVEELLTPLTEEGNTYVAIQEKGFAPFDYHQVSDGTLRLLAYITALNLDADLICFEKPENFVHPQLLRLLAEILKKSDKQIVLSTHSPYFLDHLEPEDLIIVEKKDGKTKLRRVEAEKQKKEIQNLLEEGIPLGEAYYSGAI
nr:AAA family ATPase [Candidatus Freyarchaeota archaeon]